MRVSPIVALAAVVGLTACPDPAKDKPKAQVAAAPEAVKPAAPKAELPALPGTPYTFSESGSSIGWVGAKVTATHAGAFQKFSGTIGVVDNEPTKSSVAVSIVTDSLFTADSPKLVSHLKSADFFDVATYPTATFTSTAITAGGEKGATHTVTGTLDLHGVKKSITFPATISVSPEAVTVKAEFALNRKDFNIVYPGKPDDLIRDEVVLKLDVTAKPKGT
ncbi:MAG: YceI family protein [Myxococcota bacterium]|jgi:polyisoprenoid-binding protein YceI